ncbi:MAG TPA: beta-ketoacyl-[acyl-carrier-protein] synthase family protein [Acetobacteraceae bacterium]|jgi:3-oxoacyl-[acyl-carrier-protein] synthase-1
MQPLRLSHFSIVSSIGAGQAATLSSLLAGRSGLRPCHFETVDLPTYVGEVEALGDVRLPEAFAAFDCRNNRLAEKALGQDGFEHAVATAVARYGARRIGLFLGTSTSGILRAELAYRARDAATGMLPPAFDYARTQNTGSLAAYLRPRLGIEGPSFVVSCACASTAKVFGTAARMIQAGLCDAAIVGGADSLCLTTLYGFHALALNAPGPCRPFDTARDGISIGEAGGFALLEKPHSHSTDNNILVLGVGESNDAYHMSSPHPEGVGARLAMERALAAAGLAPSAIDYINLHGTATRVGDTAEDMAVSALFGGDTPCSSTKGYTGHTLGAAGIVEAIISALAIRHGVLPGSAHTETVDPSFGARYQLAIAPARIDTVLSNSFGFGGSNCSLILGRPR